MSLERYIKQGLHLQGLPVYEADVPYIQNILYTINQAEAATTAFPYLNEEVPITVIDKGVLL